MRAKGWKMLLGIGAMLLLASWISTCGPTPSDGAPEQEAEMVPLGMVALAPGEKLRVVATTNIVADVVANVGGERIELTTLMDIGVDPHSFVPTPADTAAVHDAHVVFANGLGLESNLEEMLKNAGGNAVHIQVSEGLEYLAAGDQHQDEGHGPEGEEADPHVWFSVPNVVHWTEKIEGALSTLDPGGASYYRENSQAYAAELQQLDTWIEDQIDRIPEANRKLVTNHPSLGYYAQRYDLEQVGAVFPISPSSEPSAQDLAALEDAIGEAGVPAVFSESTVSTNLARQVAEDTGIKLVPLFSGSLGGPGSGAETYVRLMKLNTEAIVEALK
jgi:manganese/iron transport system substrate-binding protein